MTKDEALEAISILSEREMQVAVGIAKGTMPADIAKKYGLSPKTVSTFRARVMKKLGTGSNAQLAILMYEAEKVKGRDPH